MALFDLFGIGSSSDYLSGFMSEEERRRLQERAGQNALLQAGLGMLANSGYSSTPVALGQILGRGGQAGLEAYQNTLQQGSQEVMMRQRMEELKRKRQQDLMQMQAVEQAAQQYPEYADAIRANPDLLKEIIGAQFRPEAVKVVGNRLVGTRGNVIYEAPPEPEKAPFKVGETRQVRQGTKQITQEYQGADKGWVNIGEGEAFAPPSSVNINMPSESERTAGFLTQRLQGGLQQLNQVVTKNPKVATPNVGAEAVKFLTGSDYLKNLTNPEDRQRIEAAQLEVLDSALTLGTGAAYTREQLENYRKSYFPQLGDRPQTVKDKQKRLETLLESAKRKSGRAMPQGGRSAADIYNQYGAE